MTCIGSDPQLLYLPTEFYLNFTINAKFARQKISYRMLVFLSSSSSENQKALCDYFFKLSLQRKLQLSEHSLSVAFHFCIWILIMPVLALLFPLFFFFCMHFENFWFYAFDHIILTFEMSSLFHSTDGSPLLSLRSATNLNFFITFPQSRCFFFPELLYSWYLNPYFAIIHLSAFRTQR